MAICLDGTMDKRTSPDSFVADAARLRREAAKARNLADAALAEDERQRLLEVAASLDLEASMIDVSVALRWAEDRKGSGRGEPPE
ncbi:MAG: hypothetical protein EOP18_11300 [Rhizobiaceae bacterium]|nr:MAG: hypothetical protein EOP18_11300 [Rhizobiaceae bacterium]